MYKKMIICAAMALMVTGCCNNGGNECNNDNAKVSNGVSFEEVLKTRRSIRSYDSSKTISEAEVRQLLTAVQEAPSWANQQPSKYYVAIGKEKLEAVQNLVGGNIINELN